MSKGGALDKKQKAGGASMFEFEVDPGLHLNSKSDLMVKKVGDHLGSFPNA